MNRKQVNGWKQRRRAYASSVGVGVFVVVVMIGATVVEPWLATDTGAVVSAQVSAQVQGVQERPERQELQAREAAAAQANAAPDGEVKQHQLAIVIDDFGNDMDGTQAMLELPIPLNVAVMPFLPTTKRDAEWAHERGHQVLIHMPMEPVRGKREWLGPKAITTDLSDDDIRQRIRKAIADVPHAVGMNNHMGSKATADPRVMRIVLEECRAQGLFYLDSRTTPHSVVQPLARELGVRTVDNTLFLDDQYTQAHIHRQTLRMQQLAATRPSTIAIGHVGPPGKHTAQAIKQIIPMLAPSIRLAKLSDLLQG